MTDVEDAFKDAKKKNRPILIDFYGIWCPPCNQMDETVFSTPTFFQKSRSFTPLKVDADAKTSWQLKDKYHVGGYPTYIFANAQGEEIYRIVGSRPPESFYQIMDMVAGMKPRGFKQACKSKDVEDLWRCALICGERKDQKCAEAAYAKLESKLDKASIRYQMARGYAAENAPTDDLKRRGYESLIADYPQSPFLLMWGTQYVDSFDAESPQKPKKEVIEKALQGYPGVLSSPDKAAAGVTDTDQMQMRAYLLTKLEKKEEATRAWAEACEKLDQLGKALPAGITPRGFVSERIYCLESAGQSKEALDLANEYRALYPNEFTYHYAAASLLDKAKRYNEAMPVAQRAFDSGYGDNRIRAAILLIDIYATVPNQAAAQEIYERVKKDQAPDAKLDIRTHSYLKKLDTAWQKFAKK
jgi:thioredoxin-related protein